MKLIKKKEFVLSKDFLISCFWPLPRVHLAQLAAITASLAIAVPVSIAVFPQEARFKAASLEPEFHGLRVKGDSKREATYLYANKGL